MLGKIAVYAIGLALIFYRVQVYLTLRQEKLDLHVFLEENELLEYEAKLHKFGIHSKAIFARLDAHKFLEQYISSWRFFRFNSEKERLELASQKAEQEVLLLSHLQKLRIDTKYFRKLLSHGINSVEQFQENLDSGNIFIIIIISFVLGLVCGWGGISRLQKKRRQTQTSILKYMEPKSTSVTWEWTDPYVVGESMVFFIHFYQNMNRSIPYPVSPDDPILIEIMHKDTLVASSREYGGENRGRKNTMKVSFAVREAGTYRISILARGMPIRGSPFKKEFLPGTIDPSKCVVLEGGSHLWNHCTLLEVQKSIYTPLTVEARDKFGNICPLSLQDFGSSVKVDSKLAIFPYGDGKNNVLYIKLDWEGCFNAVVKFNGVPVSQGQFTVISLNYKSQTSILKYGFVLAMEPKFTSVTWEWTDPYVVGESMVFFIHFYRMNLFPYPVSPDDPILIEIMHKGTLVASSREYGGENRGRKNTMKVSFTVREAGTYRISILARGMPIRGSPFKKDFLPGTVDPSKCVVLEGGSLLEVQKNIYTPLTVEARDKFGNICPPSLQDGKSYAVEVTELGSSVKIDPKLVISPDCDRKNNVLRIKLDREGCFNAVVKYNGVPVSQGLFTVISLNSEEAKQVDENIKKQCLNVWYEAYLFRQAESSQTNGSSLSSSSPQLMMSRVYCYISRKHLSIEDFYIKIIPHRLYGFRVRPSPKIILHPHDFFCVDDGYQSPVVIMCKERNVLVATFSRLLSKIGGSESFNDKKYFFYQELVAHLGRKEGEVALKIDRQKILESSYQATVTKLCSSDWLRLFTIKFKDELGVDRGGLRREWFELLCKALFSHETGFFTRFNKDDPQALVHPNPKPLSKKLEFYEFAGRVVGKCLYESALGSSRRLNVKARFSRSFLAQLLGLRVSYKYFESDDKDLYRSKIRYIEETDPEDLALVFAEEQCDKHGRLVKSVDLKPGGRHIQVTESNKMEYLDLLAQYRLSSSCKQEIEAFAKGLNELVPENLLSIFDEYELELLMCGTGDISVSDLRQHHSVIDSGSSFRKSLDWFWTIVTSFTQDELARLVQFITGSSGLPPGGFAELSPQIQISSAPTTDALPSAHTCFNQLCLPSYSSFTEIQKKLVLAINEGSEGFSML